MKFKEMVINATRNLTKWLLLKLFKYDNSCLYLEIYEDNDLDCIPVRFYIVRKDDGLIFQHQEDKIENNRYVVKIGL